MHMRGFTLVEMIIAIIITGIIAAVVAVFMKTPIESYFASSRRAELTDIADTALRRIARDVQAALPNSLRPFGASSAIEMLVTTTGGRYSQNAADATGCFAGGCTQITTLGSVIATSGDLVGQRLVIYNLHPNDGGGCGASNPSAWCGNNSAVITSSSDGGENDAFGFASTAFRPSTGSPSRAFFVVSGPVAYVCRNVGVVGGNGTGDLVRYENYPITAASSLPNPAVAPRLLAERVSACSFDYAPGVTERNGLLALYLELMEAGERVALIHQIHVDNAP